MTRHVFDNYQTAHVWAAQSQESGRSHNGNLFFDGPTLYSYGRHFPVGIACQIDGAPMFFLNDDKYSVSTTQHQSYARNATHGQVYYIPGLRELDGMLSGPRKGPDARKLYTQRIRDHFLSHGIALEYDQNPDVAAMAAIYRRVGFGLAEAERRARTLAKDMARRAQTLKAQAAKDETARNLQAAKKYASMSYREGRAWALKELATYTYFGRAETILRDKSRAIFRAVKAAKAKGWTRIAEKAQSYRKGILDVLRKAESLRAVAYRQKNARKAIALIRQALDPDSPIQIKPITESIRHNALTVRYKGAADSAESLAATPYARIAEATPGLLGLSDRFREQAGKHSKAYYVALQKEQEEIRAEWLAGGNVSAYGLKDSEGGALLRAANVKRDESGAITGGELQTSQGARVPLVAAIKAFRFLKLVREKAARNPDFDGWTRNGARLPVGSFQIDRIDRFGNFVAGCHKINWQEVQRLAGVLDVAGLAPSQEALRVVPETV